MEQLANFFGHVLGIAGLGSVEHEGGPRGGVILRHGRRLLVRVGDVYQLVGIMGGLWTSLRVEGFVEIRIGGLVAQVFYATRGRVSGAGARLASTKKIGSGDKPEGRFGVGDSASGDSGRIRMEKNILT